MSTVMWHHTADIINQQTQAAITKLKHVIQNRKLCSELTGNDSQLRHVVMPVLIGRFVLIQSRLARAGRQLGNIPGRF